jgi:hypothetical protein
MKYGSAQRASAGIPTRLVPFEQTATSWLGAAEGGVGYQGTQSRTSLWIVIGMMVFLVAVLAIILTGSLDHREIIARSTSTASRRNAPEPVRAVANTAQHCEQPAAAMALY